MIPAVSAMKKKCSRHFAVSFITLLLGILFAGRFNSRAQTGFAPGTLVNAGSSSSPWSVAVADVNGDGKPDLIVPNISASTVEVFTNKGNGTFAATPASYPAGNGAYWVATAVIRASTKPAIICANINGGTLSVLTNNGGGIYGSNATYNVGVKPVCGGGGREWRQQRGSGLRELYEQHTFGVHQ
jgi:hypothetical protein